jgi:hypothetical protein
VKAKGGTACEVEQATASPSIATVGACVGGAVGAELVSVFGLACLVLPGAASAQRPDDRAQFDASMNMLERSVADFSNQIERLR